MGDRVGVEPVVVTAPWHDVSGRAVLYYGDDCLRSLNRLEDESVHCVVTGPPYWKLRDYGVPGQLGHEATPAEYVASLVRVFREVRRVLRRDGTLWINLADTRTGAGLLGLPWRVALALQEDGWRLVNDVVWAKSISHQLRHGSCRPDGARMRISDAHEYLFLFSKSKRYWYDQEAVKEPSVSLDRKHPSFRPNSLDIHKGRRSGVHVKKYRTRRVYGLKRNLRSVWFVQIRPHKGRHPAVAPPELFKPCVIASCPPEGVVLDPFSGSGTTGQVALANGRNFVGLDLNAEYLDDVMVRLRGSFPPGQSILDHFARPSLDDFHET